MEISKYIDVDYVPRVDLTTLGNTFNTLEAGHQASVKAASDLKKTIAEMDMNSDEDGFKQLYYNKIVNTIEENTLYGNSYVALDDLVELEGNINSAPDIIGRLNAQKAYTAFQTSIDENDELPESYKQMYKELNPYHYEDIYDKNGNIVSGTVWTPKLAPTKVIPQWEIMTDALAACAQESGQGTITRWLDKNGQITTDPQEAFDGEVYNTTTNNWEKLPREKIIEAIHTKIRSTPGALESIQQDYNVARYHTLKNNAITGTKTISEVTDDQGELLDIDQYVSKTFGDFADIASYYRVKTSTSYGDGLATYNKARNMLSDDDLYNMLFDRTASGNPVNIKVDPGSNILVERNGYKQYINSIYKELTGNDFNFVDGQTIELSDIIGNSDVPNDIKYTIADLINRYNDCTENLNQYLNAMSDTDRINYMAALRLKNGQAPINSANGGSKLEDAIIENRNRLKSEGVKYVRINVGDDEELNRNFNDLFAGEDYNQLTEQGISLKNGYIIIPIESNYYPMLASLSRESVRRRNLGPWDTIVSGFDDRIDVDYLDSNMNQVDTTSKTPYSATNFGIGKMDVTGGYIPYASSYSENINTPINHKDEFLEIGKLYDDIISNEDTLNDKYNFTNSNILADNQLLDGNNFTAQAAYKLYSEGKITQTQYNKIKQYWDEDLPRAITNIQYAQRPMYADEDQKGQMDLVESSKDRFNIGEEIKQAQKDKRTSVNPSYVRGVGFGYNITVLGENGEASENKSYFIPDATGEKVIDILNADPSIKSLTILNDLNTNQGIKTLTNTNMNPALGNNTIKGIGSDMYQLNLFGINTTVDTDTAVPIITGLEEYKNLKINFLKKGDNDLTSDMNNTLKECAAKIGNSLGIDSNGVYLKLLDDIDK